MKRTHLALAAIFVLALALRCVLLAGRGIWYDDAFSILLSSRGLSELLSGTAADTMPPLYYILLHYWLLLSPGSLSPATSLAWARLLNVIISLLVVGLLYGLVSQIAGKRAGLWAAFLTAISPFQIYHAQEIRMYALLAAAQLGYLFFFWRTARSAGNSRLNWVGLIICSALALYSHNLAVFGLIVPNIYLLLKRNWRLSGGLLLAQGISAVIFLPWLLLVPGQIQKIQAAFWTPRPGLLEVIQSLAQLTGSLPLPAVEQATVLALSILLIVLLIFEVRRLLHKAIGLDFLILAASIPPLGLFLISYLMRPVFVTRGFILSAAALLGLAGVVIACGRVRAAGYVMAGALILSALVSLPYQYRFDSFPRSPYQQACAYLVEAVSADTLVLHENKLSYFPCRVYQPELPQEFIMDAPGSANDNLALQTQQALNLYGVQNIQEAAAEADEIAFVVFSRAIEEYRAAGLNDDPNLAWLEAHYQLLDVEVFNDLEIYQFAQPAVAELNP
jgi:uncharacterized membrane protein